MKRVGVTLLVVACLSLGWAQGFETCESIAAQAARAYRAIPHAYTPFAAEQSGLAEPAMTHLKEYFLILDAAVVARVDAEKGLARGQSAALTQYENRLAEIELRLKALGQKASLGGAVQESLLALADQHAFLKEWAQQAGPRDYRSHPKVSSASGHLQQAYAKLQKAFPKGSAAFQKSNFDSHCALDFI
jgi:hypothetical protein